MKILRTKPSVGNCDNNYIDGNTTVRSHFHITGKYRDSVYRDCKINVKLNQENPVVFRNLKKYNSHLIMQKLGKFSFKLNGIPNGLKKYMSFSINNKLIIIDSFQFLSCSLNSLVKNLGKVDYKYLSQEFDNNILDIAKQKGFHTYDCKSDFKKCKEELPSKEKFYLSLTGKKISEKEYDHVLKVWNKFEKKKMRDYHDLYLKCDILLLADFFEKFRNNS